MTKKKVFRKLRTVAKNKKTARRKSVGCAAASTLSRVPNNYETTDAGLIVPRGTTPVVPPGKLRAGFSKAKSEIKKMTDDIIQTMAQDYFISEIELTASFNADGKFMGFGVGGAASFKIKIAPSSK